MTGMELSFRAWLIILGLIFIGGLLLHGYYTMRKNRRNNIKLAIDKHLSFRDAEKVDYYNGELPGGGARLVRRSGAQQAGRPAPKPKFRYQERPADGGEDDEDLLPDPLFIDEDEVRPSAGAANERERHAERERIGDPEEIDEPEPAPGNEYREETLFGRRAVAAEPAEPELTEAARTSAKGNERGETEWEEAEREEIEIEEARAEETWAEETESEPEHSAEEAPARKAGFFSWRKQRRAAQAAEEQVDPLFANYDDGTAEPEDALLASADAAPEQEPLLRVQTPAETDAAQRHREPKRRGFGTKDRSTSAAARAGKSTRQQPAAQNSALRQREIEEVIAINVFANEGNLFRGTDLAGIVLACGMRFGEMNIFHRNEGKNGTGEVQFSMANAVKPGYFDIDRMDGFTTPCVSFFMSLPGPKNSMAAFDAMLETARCVANNLGGELRDEQHSTLTGQTVEHNRQKIRDYERRQLSLLN